MIDESTYNVIDENGNIIKNCVIIWKTGGKEIIYRSFMDLYYNKPDNKLKIVFL